MIIEARAKINLALDILGKRRDGYHEVSMIMQSIELADRLKLTERPAGISITANIEGLDCGPSNLIWRAAELVKETFRVDRGIHIDLEKNIPMAAGLAGGSTDAAAVLVALNKMWDLGLNINILEGLGAKLGSDVPFCINGGTMLATGRGERLTPLSRFPHCWIVLAKLPVDVSTAWVYGNYRAQNVFCHPDIAGMKKSLDAGDLGGIAGKLGNVLESVTIPAYPEIAKLKRYMVEYGAMASLMSGSGPTVFGLVLNKEKAEIIAEKLSVHTDAQIIITETGY